MEPLEVADDRAPVPLLTVYTDTTRNQGVRRSLNRRVLERWRAEDDLTIDSLVENAEALLRDIAPTQTRYKVRERPDVRTIRYYVSQKLLPKPVGYEGGRARYTGAHLLRLLLIKRLQAEHWTLQHIATSLKGLDDEGIIERLLDLAPPKTHPPRPRAEVFAQTPREQIDVAPEVALDLPHGLLTDRTRRQELAARLESLAVWLRQAPEEEDEEH